MSSNATGHSAASAEGPAVAAAIAVPVHETAENPTAAQAARLGKSLLLTASPPLTMTAFAPLDCPPPAYEATSAAIPNTNNAASGDAGADGDVIEAPPPYCLVDPSKVRNLDHIPHYPHISPVEIVDLNTNSNNGHDQVYRRMEKTVAFDRLPGIVSSLVDTITKQP